MLIIANTIWLFVLGFWTIFLYQLATHDNLFHYAYNLAYAAFMIPSALIFIPKLHLSKNKVVHIFFSVSSVCFLLANTTWFYFNQYLETAVPYPSLADFLWLAFYIFALVASIHLFKAQSPRITNLFEIIFITIAVFLPLHSFMSQNISPSDSILTTTLNFLYPLLDSFLVAIFLTILRNSPNSKLINLPFLFSFLFFTLADALFAYQTNSEKYWNGNITDFFFALAAFLFCLGCIRLSRSETLVSLPSNTQAKP